MAKTLAEIRAKLQAQDFRSNNGKKQQSDTAVYPHWNIAEGTTARVRFLPDGNTGNDFFWVERAMIKLPFAGIKGQADSKPVVVQVPCVEMWGQACPVLAEVRTWFKSNDASLEELGRKYWKKKSYLFQGFVHDNPLSDDKTPENPIRRFIIGAQIFNLVKNGLVDPDMENSPTDYESGLDFNIKKTSKGGYADYTTSTWSRKESALSSEEAEAIEKFGLYNLSDFLPKQPSAEDVAIIKEMFEASVDGQPYDAERWGNHYKPPGLGGKGATGDETPVTRAAAPAAAAAPTMSVVQPWEEDAAEAAEAPVVAPAAKPSSQRAEDILAMIRAKKQ
jgi:hypothetical protein